ncbi:MAG: BrnT family toxin [Nitrosomonadales bacterium]|nr:BrnT family toxin [Nitrosomonadales bacterium]
MRIEFDPKKAASNLKKHGVSFDEAASCLLDPLALVCDDPDAGGEVRFVLVGMSHVGRLLTVCYTLRDEEAVRLISARKATKKEEKSYAQGI